MITNIKKVNYTVVELDRQDLFNLLLGHTIEDETSRALSDEVEPHIFRLYCSSPADPHQLINQLTHIAEQNEKKVPKRTESESEG